MSPVIAEVSLIERPQIVFDRRLIQKSRSGRNEQSDRVLHRVNVIDELLRANKLKEIYIIVNGSPWCERHPCWSERNANVAKDFQDSINVFSGMFLLQVC